MPLELSIWRIDQGLEPIQFGTLDLESRLEDLLEKDISIAAPHWMVIGRQVPTQYGHYIDLLALDCDGKLVVIELKRDKTPRDIVAQVLDYGSWVRGLRNDDVARIFHHYQQQYGADATAKSIDTAFCQHFDVAEMPEELNDSHDLVIVASALDASTERVVQYLAEEHGVNINAIFFRVFQDGEREYLTRAWLTDPTVPVEQRHEKKPAASWNGEYYVSFGGNPNRDWEEARRYGFISGGGGSWFSNTLGMLEAGDRVWVNVPGKGYVGVGEVTEPVVPIEEFLVDDGKGERVPITDLETSASNLLKKADDEERAEYMVRVRWIKTVPLEEAIREKGFFGNQNTVARPRTPKWDHTVERLKRRLGVD